MAVQGSDGLSLLIGDGEVSESFAALSGAVISRLEVVQALATSNGVADSAWQTGVGVSQRRAVIECEALATDTAPASRLRSLALNGEGGMIRLQVASDETLAFQAYVTEYREVLAPGQIKKLVCRLESAGTLAFL